MQHGNPAATPQTELSHVDPVQRAGFPPPSDSLLHLRPRRGAAGRCRCGRELAPEIFARFHDVALQVDKEQERLLRDIGLDRATARFEATKGFWA